MTQNRAGISDDVNLEAVVRALIEACRRGHAEVIEFTVGPRASTSTQPRPGQEWLVEFAEPPRAPAVFVQVLDDTLQQLCPRYRARRRAFDMPLPHVLELPVGTFYRWMRERALAGGCDTVPRLTDDRTVADALLAIVAARTRYPLIAVGADPDRSA